MYQSFHHICIIIHILQENGLIPQRNTGERQSLTGIFKSGGTLPRMIYMNTHPNRPMLSKYVAQLLSDPLGHKYGDSRTDTNKLYVRNLPESSQKIVQLPIHQEQRVSTT